MGSTVHLASGGCHLFEDGAGFAEGVSHAAAFGTCGVDWRVALRINSLNGMQVEAQGFELIGG